MSVLIDDYAPIVGPEVIDQLRQLSKPLQGASVVHLNSTREGGGVAEILARLVPLTDELGLTVRWETITGAAGFYQCTKMMHNALQGNRIEIPSSLLEGFEATNRETAQRLQEVLQDADFVFVHDPQPAAVVSFMDQRKGRWVWRCHIDVSHPYRTVWKYLRGHVLKYDASIWSLATFTQLLPQPLYLIPPSIDPLSAKNIPLEAAELDRVYTRWNLDPSRPIVAQISRFDRFKDPLGVIRAYRLVRGVIPLQLVLAGGGATDDPEGQEVLDEVQLNARDDPDIHVLLLPPDAHREINALQRIADIVIQKSTREGFGLTVTEAMWKGKPVIGGDAGGIRLQVINHHTGFLVTTPEGAALRIRYLLKRRELLEEMGYKAQQFVRDHFLITRHLREYLTLMTALRSGNQERIEAR